jgi:hypothetical protein
MERLKIGKQIEKSLAPGSLFITGLSNEGQYLAPGAEGDHFEIVNGFPTWATLTPFSLSGTDNYIARFNDAGDNVENSTMEDRSQLSGYTDIWIHGTDDVVLTTPVVNKYSLTYTTTTDWTFGVNGYIFGLWDSNNAVYGYDWINPAYRVYEQKTGTYLFRDTNTDGHLWDSNPLNGISIAAVDPDIYTTYPFKRLSNNAYCDTGLIAYGQNSYSSILGRGSGLLNVEGDILISNHILANFETPEGSDFLKLASFSYEFGTETITSGDLTVGNFYKIKVDNGDDFTGVCTVISGVLNTADCIFRLDSAYTLSATELYYSSSDALYTTFKLSNDTTRVLFNTVASPTYSTGTGYLSAFDFCFEDNAPSLSITNSGIITNNTNTWNFGGVANTADVAATKLITVVIDGTTYKLLATT